MPRLRIGVDARALQEPPGGLRRYLESMLPALYQAGHEFEWTLFVPGGAMVSEPLRPPGDRITVVPGSLQAWLRAPWEEWLLPRALGAAGIDVLFSPYGASPRRSPCPVVSVIHDLYFKIRPDTLGFGHRRYWNSVASRLRHAAAVITPSESVRRDAIALLGLDPKRAQVVPHGVSLAFHPGSTTAPGAGSVKGRIDGSYVLTFGPWTPRKNLELLVEATRGLVDERGQPVRLAVVATPRTRPWPDHVVFLDGLTDHELAASMRGAVMSCIPSLHEGFGLPAIEAMACGSPLLVSDAGALPEVTGGAAVVVESGDPLAWRAVIERLLADPEERRRLGLAGIERSHAFSWAAAAQRTCEALRGAAAATAINPA